MLVLETSQTCLSLHEEGTDNLTLVMVTLQRYLKRVIITMNDDYFMHTMSLLLVHILYLFTLLVQNASLSRWLSGHWLLSKKPWVQFPGQAKWCWVFSIRSLSA